MLNPAPKPGKHKKKTNHYRRNLRATENSLLKLYRDEQRQLALERDSGWCVWCFYKKKILTSAIEVHHVYGRGTLKTKDEYERYIFLLSLCRSCHHDFHDRGTITREQFIELLDKINGKSK